MKINWPWTIGLTIAAIVLFNVFAGSGIDIGGDVNFNGEWGYR